MRQTYYLVLQNKGKPTAVKFYMKSVLCCNTDHKRRERRAESFYLGLSFLSRLERPLLAGEVTDHAQSLSVFTINFI